jgi:zinc protease
MHSRCRFHFCLALAALALVLLNLSTVQAAEIARETLKNGLRVVVVRNTLAPAVAIQLNYLAGSCEAPPGFPGMAHAQEHMMFRGSPGMSPGQLSALVAAMGGDFNADTQQVVTQYLATVAVEDLDAALHVEAIRMRGVLDSAKAWAEERGAIEQEVDQDLSDPEYLLGVQLQQILFAGTPYQLDALGTRTSFDKTTAAMLQKFHRDWYAPNNAVLVIVGAVDPGRTLDMVRRLFGPIPARPVPPRQAVQLQKVAPAFLELESNLPYGLAVAAYRLPGYQSPDYAAGQLLGDVLESPRGNLYTLVTEGKALSTGFEGIMLPKAGAGLVTAAFPQGGDGKALLAQLNAVVAGYLENGIPAELVAAAKRHEIAAVEFQKNSITGLASAWSQAVAVEGRDSPEDDVEAIRRVSVEEVNRVARAYLVNGTAVTALLTPRPSGKPVEAKGFGRGKESFMAKHAQPVRLPAWARKVAKVLPVPNWEPRPEVFRLANGLRLIVKTAPASATVSVFGRVKNSPDMETPAGKEGVSDLLDGLFSYGTTSLDRLAYQVALDEIAADASVGTSFSLTVLKEHLARGTELLADNLLNPALPDAAFKVVRQETASVLAGELQSSGFFTEQALKGKLYPKGDPSLRHATPESVAALTLDDVRSYHRKVFRPDLTTIVVIGAISPEEARRVIENCFGKWQAEGPRPETDLPKVPLNGSSVVAVPDASRVQDEAVLAETLGLTRSHPDYYPLQVGLHVLSGGFYATRLYRDLRERTGLVYSVEAFLRAGKTRSSFGVYYGCDPQNVTRAQLLIERDLRQVQARLVQPDELQRAKTLLLRQMLLQMTGTASVAAELLELSLLDLPLDEPARAAKRYREITARQVRDAFARRIRPDDLVRVTRGPAPR